MGTSAAPICGASAGRGAGGGIWAALSADSAGVYNQAMAEYDARQLDDLAAATIARGEDDAKRIGEEGRRVQGAQRAAFAGQDIDVGVGTAADLQLETLQLSARDEQTARLNAMEEARGLRAKAASTRADGRMGRRAASNQAVGTLLTGGSQAISMAAQGVESYQRANPRIG